jgi:hypothetical protein
MIAADPAWPSTTAINGLGGECRGSCHFSLKILQQQFLGATMCLYVMPRADAADPAWPVNHRHQRPW